MRFKRLSWLLILILMLSMPALACSTFGFGGDEEPAAANEDDEEPAEDAEADEEEAAAEEAAEEEETTEEVAVEEETDEEEPVDESDAAGSSTEEESADEPVTFGSTVNISDLSLQNEVLFDDYRFILDFSFTPIVESGEPVTQSIYVDAVFNAVPQAFGMVFFIEGVEGAEEFSSFSMAQIDETTYMTLPEVGCISSSAGDVENPFADLTDQDQFLQDVGDAQLVGEETVNGIESLHYAFDETSMEGDELGDIRTVNGHVYIAKDQGYIVRFVMDGEGKLDDFTEVVDQEGTFHIQFDLLDVNSGQVVVIPEGCEAGAAGGTSEYPMLDDATNVTSFSGILIYSTAVPFADIITFYNDELAAAGWSYAENESFILENSTAILVFVMDNGAMLNITVTEDPETAGAFLVSVFDATE